MSAVLLTIGGLGLFALGYLIGHSNGKEDSHDLYIEEQNKRWEAVRHANRAEDERDDAFAALARSHSREVKLGIQNQKLLDEIARLNRAMLWDGESLPVLDREVQS